jgi:hypothetical protein
MLTIDQDRERPRHLGRLPVKPSEEIQIITNYDKETLGIKKKLLIVNCVMEQQVVLFVID